MVRLKLLLFIVLWLNICSGLQASITRFDQAAALCKIAMLSLSGSGDRTEANGSTPALAPIDIEGFLQRNQKFPEVVRRFTSLIPPALHAQIFYQILKSRNPELSANFFDAGLKALDNDIEVSNSDLKLLPKSPYLLFSNHPTGVLDGFIIANILRRVGQDKFKIFVAHFLKASFDSDPRFKNNFLYLDRRETEEAKQINRGTFKEVFRNRKEGYVNVLFGAGSIAQKGKGPFLTTERQWHPTTVSLAKVMGTAVPVYIHTRNHPLYYIFDKIHPTLRRTLYFWVLLKNQHQTIPVRIGKPLSWEEIEASGSDDAQRLQFMKKTVLDLRP